MQLRVLGRYRNDALKVAWEEGQVIEVDPPMALFLRTDAPGCFEQVEQVSAVKAVMGVADKMQRVVRAKKLINQEESTDAE